MGMLQEFKEFAVKGNVVDLAVGLVMGGAFGKIVSALVTNVIMPPIGYVLGGVDFKDLKFVIRPPDPAIKDDPGVMLQYGMFIQTLVDFTIIALAMFLLVKAMNKLKRPAEPAAEAPPAPTGEEKLLMEIRDLLKIK